MLAKGKAPKVLTITPVADNPEGRRTKVRVTNKARKRYLERSKNNGCICVRQKKKALNAVFGEEGEKVIGKRA
jgi:hypothetical protein